MNRRRTYIGGWEDMELVSNFVISKNGGSGSINLNGADDKILIIVSCVENKFKDTSAIVFSEDMSTDYGGSYGLSCGVSVDRSEYRVKLQNNTAEGPCRILVFRY